MNKSNFSIIDITLKVATYVLLLMLFLAYISPYISPAYTKLIPLMGLVSPIIILANIIVAIYWILRWDKVAILCVVVLLLGIGHISKFVQIPVQKEMPQKGPILKIITFNAHYFTTSKHKDVITKTLHTLDTLNADILCIQEFATSRQDNMEEISKKLRKYQYHYHHSTQDSSTKINYYTAIYSKFKIINKGEIHFNAIANSSIYADILYRNDTIRVFNNHLQSSSMTSSDIKFLSGEDADYSEKGNNLFRLFSIGEKLTINNKLRSDQADTIKHIIDQTPYSIIVCGDHNVIPMSYTYRKVRGNLQDAFINKGKWYGYTYKSFGHFLRIDFIFHSNTFKTISYGSPDIMWSDHKPVIVELKYTK